MKGSKKVIDILSEALAEELTAVNQYFLHAEMCENWGYGKLASFIKKKCNRGNETCRGIDRKDSLS